MPELKRVTIKGLMLRCGHCGGSAFIPRKWQLTAPLTSCLGLDSLNEAADVFVCAKCGQLYWFLFKDTTDPDCVITDLGEDYDLDCVEIAGGTLPEQVVVEVEDNCAVEGVHSPCASSEDPDISELDEDYDVACVRCGQLIPAGQSVCAGCGWTYKE